MAADLLLALDALGSAPERYLILELSGELRGRQANTLADLAPALVDRVEWLDGLPETFSGCLIANEVLDEVKCTEAKVYIERLVFEWLEKVSA